MPYLYPTASVIFLFRTGENQGLLCILSCPSSVNEASELAQANGLLPDLPALVRAAAAVGSGYKEGGSCVPFLRRIFSSLPRMRETNGEHLSK